MRINGDFVEFGYKMNGDLRQIGVYMNGDLRYAIIVGGEWRYERYCF